MMVVKVGGAAAASAPALMDIAALKDRQLLVVHGGGPEVTAWSTRMGLQTQFVDGRRVTDADTADVAEMVLAGRVGRALAAQLTALGAPAVSLCGKDAGLFTAEAMDPTLGQVGRVASVDATLLEALWAAGITPLVAPIAEGPDGLTYNINGDDAAADLAVALGATTLVLVSDVPGVLVDGRPVEICTADDIEHLIAAGVIRGGMVAKVRACLRATAGGVDRAVIVDGTVAGAVAAACEGAAVGTAIVA